MLEWPGEQVRTQKAYVSPVTRTPDEQRAYYLGLFLRVRGSVPLHPILPGSQARDHIQAKQDGEEGPRGLISGHSGRGS